MKAGIRRFSLSMVWENWHSEGEVWVSRCREDVTPVSPFLLTRKSYGDDGVLYSKRHKDRFVPEVESVKPSGQTCSSIGITSLPVPPAPVTLPVEESSGA